MNYFDVLKNGCKKLVQNNIDNAQFDAECLFEDAFEINKDTTTKLKTKFFQARRLFLKFRIPCPNFPNGPTSGLAA